MVVGTMTMSAVGFSFLQSTISIAIVNRRQEDHLLDDDKLIQVRQWRSACAMSLLIPFALIGCTLSCFIKEDLRRINHGQGASKSRRQKDYEGDDEDNIASDDELLPETKNEE